MHAMILMPTQKVYFLCLAGQLFAYPVYTNKEFGDEFYLVGYNAM
jgi:hypothetical protein